MNNPDESRSVFFVTILIARPLPMCGVINGSCSDDQRFSKQNCCLPVHTGCRRRLYVTVFVCRCVRDVVLSRVKSQ